VGDVRRRLDDIRRDVDAADQHVLALEEPDQFDRNARIAAFKRDPVDPSRRKGGEGLLILAPTLAERRFPVAIGLDAVAVADERSDTSIEAVGTKEIAVVRAIAWRDFDTKAVGGEG
jgi:hypothetical protein